MTMGVEMLIKIVYLLATALLSESFVARPYCDTYAFKSCKTLAPSQTTSTTTSLCGTNGSPPRGNSKLRNSIMERRGEYFKLDRFRGRVEFGSTADLVTTLPNGDADTINKWLGDERRVALSIWDEKMLKEKGNSVYQLDLMTLQFVTIQLAPSVDVLMWVEEDVGQPIFRLESVSFDPNVQILPGVGVTAESLGIQIDVCGELRVSEDGKGVTGRIGFLSSGDLSPPLRLLPEFALKSATELINREIKNFAVASFQKGSRAEYRKFQLRQRSLKKDD